MCRACWCRPAPARFRPAWKSLPTPTGCGTADVLCWSCSILRLICPPRRTFLSGRNATTSTRIVTVQGRARASCATSTIPARTTLATAASRPQWQNSFAIQIAGRGFDAQISTEFAVELPDSACVFCGNCVEVCPTGALSFKSEYDMRAADTWDESKQTTTTTVCTYCGVGCNLELHVQDNKIVKVNSPHDHSVSHGNLCIKGRFGFVHVQNREEDGNG